MRDALIQNTDTFWNIFPTPSLDVNLLTNVWHTKIILSCCNMFYKKGKVIFDHPREEKFKQNSCTSKLRPKNSLQLFFAVFILFWGLVGWRRRLLGIGKLYFCFFFNPRQTKVTTGFSLLPQISNLFIETQSWIRILCFFSSVLLRQKICCHWVI